MDNDRDHGKPGSEETAEAPDLATVLTDSVRAAALRLPRDRVLPVLYVVDPFPEQPGR